MSGHTTTSSRGESYQMEMSRWTAGRNVLRLAALISIIGCVAGYFVDRSGCSGPIWSRSRLRRPSAWERFSSSWCSI